MNIYTKVINNKKPLFIIILKFNIIQIILKYLFKILLIGNSTVGKESLIIRYVDNMWDDGFVPTIGVDFVRYNI